MRTRESDMTCMRVHVWGRSGSPALVLRWRSSRLLIGQLHARMRARALVCLVVVEQGGSVLCYGTRLGSQ